ncbi:MAG: DUF3034 family protein [Deltaproteobacteria bacterium]
MKLQKLLLAALAASTLGGIPGSVLAGTETSKTIVKEEAPAPEKGAPLPLHQIEGNGGVLTTLSAYIVNPPRNGEPVGRPAIGTGFISLNSGRYLLPTTLTWSPWERIELGYGADWYTIGSLATAVNNATGIDLNTKNLWLHNFNARFQLVKENDFGQKWVPAITGGVHYKYNSGYDSINNQLGGALSSLGITSNQGVDFTLYGTKLLTFLPRPLLLNAGLRATRGVELGLLGFTNEYQFLFEGNAAIFLTDWLILAAEYRMQPNNYNTIPGVVGRSSDWITIDLAWVVNKHLTIAGGWGHFGNVANEQANGVWGLTAKYEF